MWGYILHKKKKKITNKTKIKKKKKKKNPVGRPPEYKTAEQLQKKIKSYFNHGVRSKQVIVGTGKRQKVVKIPVPTITGLVLYCGFADRCSFYEYEEKKEFTYTIKRARTFIEREYEEQLQSGNCTGAIFALKNFSWHDKIELEHGIRTLTKEERFEKENRLRVYYSKN